VPVQREKISLPVIASGLVVPAEEVKLSFKTGGLISAIYVEEGAQVTKGDLLAVLNLSEIEAQVEQYRGGYDKSLRDFNRAKKLYADSVATLEQMQNAETALKVSKAGYDAASFNLQHSRIVAPENGTILKKLAETSEMIAPGYPVFLFGTSNKGWKIRTGLADKDFVRITTGDTARVTLDAYRETGFKATVARISETANPLTGTFEVELDLKSQGKKLAAGFVANLEIYPGRGERYISLPVQSLIGADGSYGYVFTANDSLRAKKVRVRIFKVYQSSVAVYDDPELVGRVITEGAAYISDGSRVIIAP
jgi:RND family efflux transporter MFP subunit